jgi:hypothetical protein
LIRRLIIALAAVVLGVPAAAQQPPPPRLLVLISIDGLSTALLDEYRPQFSGGFAVLSSGAVFRIASSASPTGQAIGDAIKAQWPGSRKVAVAGTQGAPLPVSGSNADQSWFWAGNRFDSGRPTARVPKVVAKVNAAVAAALARPRPPLEATPFCQSKAAAGASGGLGRNAGDVAAFSASPELDGDTLGLAAGLVDEMKLGRGSTADVLAIGLSATANAERAYGAQSEQMCLQLTELDREIGDFLALLDNRGIDYAVALTGSGQGQAPVMLWRPGFRGGTVDAPVAPGDLEKTLAVLIGLPAAIEGRCLEGTPAFCT